MEFEEIRPYHDEELPQIFEELIADPAFQQVACAVMPGVPFEAIAQKMRASKTKQEFQENLCYGILHKLAKDTTDGLILESMAVLNKQSAYTYVSNHRDIILDSGFLSVLLVEQGLDTVEIAIGDNLLIYPWIKKLVRINKCFTVQRALTMRQMLESSIRMSRYMHYTIAEKKQSIWIAQREGRAKDSNDITQDSVLKMLAMGGDGDIITNLQELNIVPLSIRVIYLINKEVVNDEFISAQLDREQFGRVLNKEIKQEIRPLVSDLVFDQTIRIRDDGFDRASEIIYEWAYQHISLIFGQMPKKMESVSYEVMGYKLKVVAEKEYFLMDMQTISNEEAGMIWHVVAELRKESDGLYLTCRHICENIYSRERRYNRPKFMRDIFNQVGFLDAGVFMDEDTEAVPISAGQLKNLLSHDGRSLPVILVDKPEQIPDWAQDFDGYTINAEVLCKSLAGICHVFLGDESCISRMQEIYGNESIDGAVFYWGRDDESPTIFTQEAIRRACFEEVNHSVDEDEEYEKAFRYRLRELVCQEFH